ncbi:MAG: hypothetical protein ACYDHU_07965 [Acidimicrobiales bacterium]
MPYVVVVGAAVLAVVAFFAVSAIATTNGLAGVPTGPGTATVTWHPASSTGSSTGASGGTLFTPRHVVSQPFTGTVAGLSLTGRATPDLKTFSKILTAHLRPSPASPVSFVIFHWTGTLGGSAFSLSISDVLEAPLLTTSHKNYVAVTGTFDRQPVQATARAEGPASRRVLAIRGSIGNFSFTGGVVMPAASSGASKATATFTLSS